MKQLYKQRVIFYFEKFCSLNINSIKFLMSWLNWCHKSVWIYYYYASFKVNLISFFLWLVQTLSLIIWLSHNIRYKMIFLNSWCSMFIIIVSWILINICDHAKFFIECIQTESFLIILFFLCCLCWFLVNTCVWIDHVLFKFLRSWDDTWQIKHCWFILMFVINTCFL